MVGALTQDRERQRLSLAAVGFLLVMGPDCDQLCDFCNTANFLRRGLIGKGGALVVMTNFVVMTNSKWGWVS